MKIIIRTALLAATMALAIAPATAAVGPNGEIGGLTAKFIDVNGVRTRIFDYGKGEPMLLIHGGARAGANVFSRNIEGLAKHYRVIAIDRLGSGLTDMPKDGDTSNPAQVKFVHTLIEQMKLGPVHMVGHSSGGALAFYYAMEHPDMVKNLIVLAHGPGMPHPPGEGPRLLEVQAEKDCPPEGLFEHPSCRLKLLGHTEATFEPEFWEAEQFILSQPKWQPVKERMAKAYKEAQSRPPEPVNHELSPNAYRDGMWEKVRTQGGLNMPIMIFLGKQDTLDWRGNETYASLGGSLEFMEFVGAKNRRVKTIIVNEAGHFPYREHPEQFNADVKNFIDFWRDNPNVQ